MEGYHSPNEPWCAEEDVPTAANLNLYRGRSSHVGWHSDDEPLFGELGEAKLIVSVSFGTSALFKWRGKHCPSNDGHSCWLGHGDILVMDGQCQDEFRHCTDPGSDQERINITFRWVKQHVVSCSFSRTGMACCLPTCARGFFLFLVRSWWRQVGFFRLFGFSFGALCILCKVWVSKMCLLLDTPIGWRSVGHYLCYPWGVCWAAQNTACQIGGKFRGFIANKLYMLASVGRPSPHSYDACMVYWNKEALRRICSQTYGETSFFSK